MIKLTPRPPLKICLDPGHGQDNAKLGRHDPGAVDPVTGIRECDLNLLYALELERILISAGFLLMLTRRDERTSMPVGRRAPLAQRWGADLLISIHCNAAAPSATGAEIQWRDLEDKELADILLPYILRASGLPDHGNDERDGLAVLHFDGPAILIELGFITNFRDLAVLADPAKRRAICEAIRDGLEAWRPRKVPLPVVERRCPTCRQPWAA